MKILSHACDAMMSVATLGTERWQVLRNTAKQFFDCETFFICLFDGRFIKYTPTEVKSKFEDCAAGTSFNYRETVWYRRDDEKSKFSPALYRQLGVELERSVCFPYRVNGRVSGSIEIINPQREDITEDDQKLFANLCSCLMGRAPGSQ
jgi:hypothetical protein